MPKTPITTYTRKEHKRRYLRSYGLRAPGVDVSAGSEPDVAASAHADSMMVIYADVLVLDSAVDLIGATGDLLLEKAAAHGIDGKLPAVGATGFVIVAAGETGGEIAEGVVIKHVASGLRYQCTVTSTYTNGELCPIEGIDTGESTNFPAGTILEWESPPPGIVNTAVVADNGEGDGLTGGRPEETDEELVQRIIEIRKNPAASGNSAQYRQTARRTPGLAIESVFAFDAIFGPGTVAITFTMRPPFPGASRVPTPVQLSLVEARLRNGGFPASDGLFMAAMQEEPVDVFMGVQWTKQAKGWSDVTPWPPFVAVDPVHVDEDPLLTPTATAFRLTTLGTAPAPKIGQTLAFYNASGRKFSNKRIATVTEIVAGQTWDVTIATANNVSDASFVPAKRAVVSPWSPTLTQLVTPLLKYLGTLGPGEMFATFYDEGTRQKRQPESPDESPSIISARDLGNTPPRALVSDVALYEPTPNGVTKTTTFGVPGVIVNLLTLGDFAIFQK